jgi:RNA polymerase sigma factor (sigma-70 family)
VVACQGAEGVVEDGAEAALEQWWWQLGPDALRYATVLVGPDDSHDIVVEAFLQVTSTSGWRTVQNRRAYLMRAVTNEARSQQRSRLRRERRERQTFERDLHVAASPEPELRRAIAALSVAQRAAVYFTYWEDMTIAEIATLLNLSTGTVQRTLTRARDALGKVIR